MLDAIDEHDGIRVSAKQRPLYYKRLPALNRATVAPHGRRLRPAHAEGLPVRPRVNAGRLLSDGRLRPAGPVFRFVLPAPER